MISFCFDLKIIAFVVYNCRIFEYAGTSNMKIYEKKFFVLEKNIFRSGKK